MHARDALPLAFGPRAHDGAVLPREAAPAVRERDGLRDLPGEGFDAVAHVLEDGGVGAGDGFSGGLRCCEGWCGAACARRELVVSFRVGIGEVVELAVADNVEVAVQNPSEPHVANGLQ